MFERAIEVRLRKIRAIARDLGWWDARFADRRPARIAVLPDQPGLAKRLVVLLEQPADGCHIEVSELFVHGLLENIPCCADGRYRCVLAGRLYRVGEVLEE